MNNGAIQGDNFCCRCPPPAVGDVAADFVVVVLNGLEDDDKCFGGPIFPGVFKTLL